MVGRVTAAMLAVTVLMLAGCGSNAPSSAPQTVTDRAEVQEFVREAVAYADTHGTEAALEAFSDPTGPFQRGELYIFAHDFDGNVLAHGGNPELVGQNLLGMKDAGGADLLQALMTVARDGGGWVEYEWPNPDADNEVQTKWAYALAVDDQWWVGSGTYEKTEKTS